MFFCEVFQSWTILSVMSNKQKRQESSGRTIGGGEKHPRTEMTAWTD